MAYDNEMKGVLFINDKKGNDKAPDRKGTAQINGIEYQVAGWIRETKKGDPMLSLSFQIKKPKEDEPSRDVNQPTGGGNVGHIEDEVPFITNQGV